MMRKIFALIPVCALAVACGGEATPEAKSPDAAAMDESKPAEGEAKSDEAAPADPAATDEAKPAEGEAKPAEGEAK